MRLNGVVKGLCEHLTVIVLLGFCFATSTGCDERETILVIEKPTAVLGIVPVPSQSESESASVQPGAVIVTLKAGDTARAVGVYHGQGHDGFKVKLADGTEGLVMVGETFKVTSR